MPQHMRGDFSQSRLLVANCDGFIDAIPARTETFARIRILLSDKASPDLSLSLLASDNVLSALIYWRLQGELYICQELNISYAFGFFVMPSVSCDKVTVIENSQGVVNRIIHRGKA